MSYSHLAVSQENSSGRKYFQTPHSYRSDFERDRDRIIHCSAFRRLEGKTQVFTPHINDHFRTRFTHSVEVAQIGRTIARALGLNETLTEAACLAHDIGHSPFGHAGEAVLNNLMKNCGGFEHNAQALRIIDLIERPYPDFIGLNLMYETRLAMAKHKSSYDDSQADGCFGQKNSSLEGQITDLADRIAYNCHDLEDGLRAKILDFNAIINLEICQEAAKICSADKIKITLVRNTRIAKTIIDMLVGNSISASCDAIEAGGVKSLQDVYDYNDSLIMLSSSAEKKLCQLEKFLHKNMYEHRLVKSTSSKVPQWLGKVFDKFMKKPELMPQFYQGFISEFGLKRAICDYISGMTDWYCLSMIED